MIVCSLTIDYNINQARKEQSKELFNLEFLTENKKTTIDTFIGDKMILLLHKKKDPNISIIVVNLVRSWSRTKQSGDSK